jgi:hypothetical protein
VAAGDRPDDGHPALQNAASIAKNILTTEAPSPSRRRRTRRRWRRHA